MPFCCFEAFCGKSHELLFLIKKMSISETSTEGLRKFVFITIFEKWQIPRKIWICLKKFFDQTSKRWQILTKTVFLRKLSRIQLNYVFLLFWSILGEIHRELLFFIKKWLSQKRSLKYSEGLVFLPYLKSGKSWGNMNLFKQLVFIKPVKGGIY